MSRPLISVIFPVHNESKIISRVITNFINEWKKLRLPSYEIILIENGSSDNSWFIVKKLEKKIRRLKTLQVSKASYGQALKTGLLQAKGKYVFIFNVDFYDVNFAKQALQLLKVADIVVGSKTLAASRDERSPFRRLTTYFFNVLLRLVLNYPGTDTHGIKAFRNSSLLSYSINRCRTKNELFDTELVIRLTRWGAKLVEIPVNVKEIRPTRYTLVRRLWLTAIDLLVALWSKYLILPGFEHKTVVADDYGLSKAVNQAILNSVARGEIQYVSILANVVTPPQAKALLRLRRIKFSAHLNLIEGKSISGKRQFPSLPIFLIKLVLGLVNLKEVETEWNAQINRLRKLGFTLSHIDSHQHTHVFPPLWNLLLKKSREWKIDLIRSHDSTRYALQPYPIKYLSYLVFSFLLSFRFGPNHSSPKELNEIVIHPGANY